MRTRKTVARAVATGACAAGLVAALQGQAWAATVTIEASGGIGSAQFNGDTNTFRACDTEADGWGIEARLRFPAADNKPDLVIDTRGHAANYCSPWKGGLTAGKSYRMFVTPVSGTNRGPSTYIDVRA
jgi:hypothetical protein